LFLLYLFKGVQSWAYVWVVPSSYRNRQDQRLRRISVPQKPFSLNIKKVSGRTEVGCSAA